MKRQVFWLLPALLMIAGVQHVAACNVPVFRYALEKWEPDKYEIFVYRHGPLAKKDQIIIDKLRGYIEGDKCLTNVHMLEIDLKRKAELRHVDLAGNTIGFSGSAVGYGPCLAFSSLGFRKEVFDPFVALYRYQKTDQVPYVIIRYPRYAPVRHNMWQGPIQADVLQNLLDSPARQEAAKRVLKGQTAVWFFLESGNKDKDDEALQLLQKELKKLPNVLKLPELTDRPEDKIREEGPKLKIDFSILRIKRTDPKEKMLIKMLMKMESDLTDYEKEPIVFPMFGRGVILYAIIGKGINPDNIREAGAKIVAACTCEVKKENPWIDIVTTKDWENELTGRVVQDHPLPELISLIQNPTQPKGPDGHTGKKTGTTQNGNTGGASRPMRNDTARGSNFVLYTTIAYVVGGLLLVLVGATVLISWGRKNGTASRPAIKPNVVKPAEQPPETGIQDRSSIRKAEDRQV